MLTFIKSFTMKFILVATLVLVGLCLTSYAQSVNAKSTALQQKSKIVKVIANITRITNSESAGKTVLYLTASQYKQPIKIKIANDEFEPAKAFFPGEHVSVTGKMYLRKGYQEIVVNTASQIKPVLGDNIVSTGGFN
jgi:DNA/RNA endonuclease YhcR with UshA esterase domain